MTYIQKRLVFDGSVIRGDMPFHAAGGLLPPTDLDLQIDGAIRYNSTSDALEFYSALREEAIPLLHKGIQSILTVDDDVALSKSQVYNAFVIAESDANSVEITFPELESDDDLVQFVIVRKGANQVSLVTPNVSYKLHYSPLIDDAEFFLTTNGDAVTVFYRHFDQTFYIV